MQDAGLRFMTQLRESKNILTQVNADEKINAVKNSSPNPPKGKICVNPCKSVSK